MEQFRVVCVNDRFCPSGFPPQFWIMKGEIYTVVDAKYLARQHMTIGYKLAEIELPEDSIYQYFLSNRFRPYTDEDEMIEAAVQELIEESVVL